MTYPRDYTFMRRRNLKSIAHQYTLRDELRN